jgi:CcdB protein
MSVSKQTSPKLDPDLAAATAPKLNLSRTRDETPNQVRGRKSGAGKPSTPTSSIGIIITSNGMTSSEKSGAHFDAPVRRVHESKRACERQRSFCNYPTIRSGVPNKDGGGRTPRRRLWSARKSTALSGRRIEGRRVAVTVTELATLPRMALKRYVTRLEHERARIIAALDLLFTGF